VGDGAASVAGLTRVHREGVGELFHFGLHALDVGCIMRVVEHISDQMRDLLGFVVWVASYTSAKAAWRSSNYELRKDKIVLREKANAVKP